MIKIEHVVEPSGEQMEFVIEGMRNPMNSWMNSDSGFIDILKFDDDDIPCMYNAAEFKLGDADKELMIKLKNAGKDHRKFMRQMPMMMRITAPMYWWKEFDTYKVGTVRNSCSTMHKIHSKEFTLDDFSTDHLCFEDSIDTLKGTIDILNKYRKCFIEKEKSNDLYGINPLTPKDFWWQLIQILPSSYNQTANITLNYEVLANIYNARKNHKLDEWREFCKLAESFEYAFLYSEED